MEVFCQCPVNNLFGERLNVHLVNGSVYLGFQQIKFVLCFKGVQNVSKEVIGSLVVESVVRNFVVGGFITLAILKVSTGYLNNVRFGIVVDNEVPTQSNVCVIAVKNVENGLGSGIGIIFYNGLSGDYTGNSTLGQRHCGVTVQLSEQVSSLFVVGFKVGGVFAVLNAISDQILNVFDRGETILVVLVLVFLVRNSSFGSGRGLFEVDQVCALFTGNCSKGTCLVGGAEDILFNCFGKLGGSLAVLTLGESGGGLQTEFFEFCVECITLEFGDSETVFVCKVLSNGAFKAFIHKLVIEEFANHRFFSSVENEILGFKETCGVLFNIVLQVVTGCFVLEVVVHVIAVLGVHDHNSCSVLNVRGLEVIANVSREEVIKGVVVFCKAKVEVEVLHPNNNVLSVLLVVSFILQACIKCSICTCNQFNEVILNGVQAGVENFLGVVGSHSNTVRIGGGVLCNDAACATAKVLLVVSVLPLINCLLIHRVPKHKGSHLLVHVKFAAVTFYNNAVTLNCTAVEQCSSNDTCNNCNKQHDAKRTFCPNRHYELLFVLTFFGGSGSFFNLELSVSFSFSHD